MLILFLAAVTAIVIGNLTLAVILMPLAFIWVASRSLRRL